MTVRMNNNRSTNRWHSTNIKRPRHSHSICFLFAQCFLCVAGRLLDESMICRWCQWIIFSAQPFEYELVAVVSNDAGINSVNDLRGSKFCHPGHGLESQWSEILGNVSDISMSCDSFVLFVELQIQATITISLCFIFIFWHLLIVFAIVCWLNLSMAKQYFESTLVARGCEDELSVTESRIKASANFFGPSCKPGPWVADAHEDALLSKRTWIISSPASMTKTLNVINAFLVNLFSLVFPILSVSLCVVHQQNESIHRCAKFATIRPVAVNQTSIGDVSDRCIAWQAAMAKLHGCVSTTCEVISV